MCARRSLLLWALSASLAWAGAPTLQQKVEALGKGNAAQKQAAYDAVYKDWARQHEADGDALAAAGDAVGARDAYLLALGEFAVGSYPHAWKIERDEKAGGWRVLEVTPGKRAHKAGILSGDLLVALDGESLATVGEFKLKLMLYQVGQLPLRPYRFTVQRGTQTLTIEPMRYPGIKGYDAVTLEPERTRLLEKVLRHMQATGTALPVNDNMRFVAKYSVDAMRDAADPAAKRDAIQGMLEVAYAVGWWADYQLNCGLLLEAAGAALGAERCFRNFLIDAPGDPQAPAVQARLDAMAPAIAAQRRMRAFEGFWGQIVGGQVTNSGIEFERAGNVLEVRSPAGKVYMRATLSDERRGTFLQIYDANDVPHAQIAGVIRNCFGGRFEIPGHFELSADGSRLTLTLDYNPDVDPRTCAFVSRSPYTTVYGR